MKKLKYGCFPRFLHDVSMKSRVMVDETETCFGVVALALRGGCD
jgi:hypothetical protein